MTRVGFFCLQLTKLDDTKRVRAGSKEEKEESRREDGEKGTRRERLVEAAELSHESRASPSVYRGGCLTRS